MGKHGPCRHCGVTTTPLWRNGPPDKPVLCNACGSRWRTKGSLTNYTPLHAREPINSEELKVSRVKSISFKPKEKKLNRIKLKKSCGAAENEREMPYSDQNFRKILELDTSNRSSSGSATSYSESCAHFGTTEASDLTGSAQSNVWESQVPSKKRTMRMDLECSPVEKLTQDLYTIMQEQQSCCLSSLSEDLLYESNTAVGSFELGNGSILLRYPNPKVMEEESEASSLPINNKSCLINEAYSGSASFTVHGESKGTSFSTVGIDKLKKCTAQWGQEHIKRDESMDKLHILQDRDSPLGFINLKDVVNFEVLVRHMTDEEQQQLMKYLPSTDTSKYSESLRKTLNSSHFEQNLLYFQQLLKEGIFDSSISRMDAEGYMTLKTLVLRNLSTSTWVQHYKMLKDGKSKLNTVGREEATAFTSLGRSKFTLLKRPREMQNLHVPESKGTMRSPKRAVKSSVSGVNPQSTLIYDAEEFVDNDGTCFSPRTIFASPPPERSSMLSSLQFTDDSADHDLLVDVPRNKSSFPEAELIDSAYNQKLVGRSNSYAESGVFDDGERSHSGFPASSFKGQKTRHS